MTGAPPSGTLSWQQLVQTKLGPTPQWPIREAIWAQIGYHPSPAQLAVHQRKNRRGEVCNHVLVEGGIQSGKSTLLAAEICSLLPWLSGREVWLIGPDLTQPRKECEYIIKFAKRIGLFDPKKASLPSSDAIAWRFTLRNGTVVRTFTSNQYRKLAGETPGFVGLTEPGQMADGETFVTALARAGLQDVPLWLVGTLEGVNWYSRLAARWARGAVPGATAFKLPTWSNTAVYPDGRTDWRIQKIEQDPDLPRDKFMERYGGERAAPPNLVFGKTAWHPGFDQELHVDPLLERDPTWDLEAWGDWGWDHPYAVLCVALVGTEPAEVLVLDEVVIKGIDDIPMIAHCKSKPWWPQVRRVILDPATRQHRGAPMTTAEYWAAKPPIGTGLPVWANEKVRVEDGTHRIRKLLEIDPRTGRPRLRVHPRCEHLIWEFTEGYRNLVDVNGNSQGRPIDLHNDAVKSLHYGTHVHMPSVGLHERRLGTQKRTARKALPFA